MDKKLLTTEQAAEILHVEPPTLRSWRHRDIGPAYIKVGRKVFYRAEDIENWLAKCRVEPGAMC